MKILVFKPNEKIPLPFNCVIRGFTIEPKDPFLYPPNDPICKPENRFSLILGEREEIIQNLPLAFADKRYIFHPNFEAMTFKYYRPFVLKEGTFLKFVSKVDCDFLLYVTYITDKEFEEISKKGNPFEPTRVRCEVIPINSPLGLVAVEKESRLISIAFGIPVQIDGISNVWYPINALLVDTSPKQAPLEPDVRGRITLTGRNYEFWDATFRPLRILTADIQEGRRHILKNIVIGGGKDPKRRIDLLQITLEKDIATLNFVRARKYGELNVIVEYVYI